MDIWTVEQGELVLYKRTGQCNRCGECCYKCRISLRQEIGTVLDPDDCESGEDKVWSEREGWSMFIAQGIWWYFKVEKISSEVKRCATLGKDNLCGEWMDPKTFRPICRYWPFHPSNLEKFPCCGFSFEKVET